MIHPITFFLKRHAILVQSLLCLLIFLFFFTSCVKNENWEKFRGVAGTGSTSSSIGPPLVLKWKLLLAPYSDGRRFFNQPLVTKDAIYFGSADGNFYSLNMQTGFMNWIVSSNGPVNSVPCIDKKRVYFGSADGMIYCVDRITGEIVWTYATLGQVNSTLYIYKSYIIAASDLDAVYILTTDGQLVYTLPNDSWSRLSFQVAGSLLLFVPGPPGMSETLASFDLKTQKYSWILDTGIGQYYWFSFPSADASHFYYSAVGIDSYNSLLFRVTAANLKNGLVQWEQTFPSYFPQNNIPHPYIFIEENSHLLDYASVVSSSSRLFVTFGDSMVHAVSSRNGEFLWSTEFSTVVGSAITKADNRLYFGLRDVDGLGYLVCLSMHTGDVLWRIPVEGTILNAPVITDSRIFFGTDAGFFYVFEELL